MRRIDYQLVLRDILRGMIFSEILYDYEVKVLGRDKPRFSIMSELSRMYFDGIQSNRSELDGLEDVLFFGDFEVKDILDKYLVPIREKIKEKIEEVLRDRYTVMSVGEYLSEVLSLLLIEEDIILSCISREKKLDKLIDVLISAIVSRIPLDYIANDRVSFKKKEISLSKKTGVKLNLEILTASIAAEESAEKLLDEKHILNVTKLGEFFSNCKNYFKVEEIDLRHELKRLLNDSRREEHASEILKKLLNPNAQREFKESEAMDETIDIIFEVVKEYYDITKSLMKNSRERVEVPEVELYLLELMKELTKEHIIYESLMRARFVEFGIPTLGPTEIAIEGTSEQREIDGISIPLKHHTRDYEEIYLLEVTTRTGQSKEEKKEKIAEWLRGLRETVGLETRTLFFCREVGHGCQTGDEDSMLIELPIQSLKRKNFYSVVKYMLR